MSMLDEFVEKYDGDRDKFSELIGAYGEVVLDVAELVDRYGGQTTDIPAVTYMLFRKYDIKPKPDAVNLQMSEVLSDLIRQNPTSVKDAGQKVAEAIIALKSRFNITLRSVE